MMSAGKMHVDEVDVDVALVGRLLAAQFPQWADLPIEPVHSAGTDNAIYRLGEDMAVRLPRIHWATRQVGKEHLWLPKLARSCRLPSLSRSRRGCLPTATPGAGPSAGGSQARTRPSGASRFYAKRLSLWHSSKPACSGSIPRAGHPLEHTT